METFDYESYTRYIRGGAHWIYCRDVVRDRCVQCYPWYRCERCGLMCLGVQCHHHRGYANLYHEDPATDLQGCCAECHLFLSGKLPCDPREYALSLGLNPDCKVQREICRDWHNQPTYNTRKSEMARRHAERRQAP